MDQSLSAAAEAQNASFVAKVKALQTQRDYPLQVTQRLGGSLSIEGFMSIRGAQIQQVFFCHGKTFTIRGSQEPLTLLCSEMVESLKPNVLSVCFDDQPDQVSLQLGDLFCGIDTPAQSSGGILSVYLRYETITSQQVLDILSSPSVLDLTIRPHQVEVKVIKHCDKRGSLSHLKSVEPKVFTPKCRTARSKRSIRSEERAGKRRPRRKKNSSRFLSFL